MRNIYRVLLIFLSLVSIALSAAAAATLVYIPYITDAVTYAGSYFPFIDLVLAGFMAFAALCFFILLVIALVIPGRSKDLTFGKKQGSLRFSRQTIESTVKYSFSDIPGIGRSRVRAVIGSKPEKTRIYIKLSLRDPERLSELTEAVRGKIEAVLLSSLGVTVRSINIRVAEYSPSGAPVSSGEEDKTSRVQ